MADFRIDLRSKLRQHPEITSKKRIKIRVISVSEIFQRRATVEFSAMAHYRQARQSAKKPEENHMQSEPGADMTFPRPALA